ncbi:ABC transporter [Anoxynatronum sibiricum]|uniref:ABC transporter n=1 Tax=Anoxynatronum sibiricum TaxID=210623 RepID=A0ABU9VTC1_9CLOT
MRAFSIFTFDIRYQIKYGFYFLYAVISLLYLSILLFLPESMARPAAAIIILTDPAALGFFFIGGMILLERGEGLHTYFSILPTLNREYVLSKVLSLSIISTMVALFIAGIMFRSEVNYLLLSLGVFAGASVFTLFGLAVGTVAKSINHYFVISVPVGILLMGPAFLIYLDLNNFLIEILPATLLLRLIYASLQLEIPYPPILSLVGIILWCAPAYILANRFFATYIERGGE